MDGYYNYLLTFIDKAVDDGFIMPSQRSIIVSAPSAKELVQKLEVGSCDHKLLVVLCFALLPDTTLRCASLCFDSLERHLCPVHHHHHHHFHFKSQLLQFAGIKHAL